MTLEQIIDLLKNDRKISPNISRWQTYPPKAPVYEDYPDHLDLRLVNTLKERGFDKLYAHQREAVDHVHNKKDVVVVTPTASGKNALLQHSRAGQNHEGQEQPGAVSFPDQGPVAGSV